MLHKMYSQIDKYVYFTLNKEAPLGWGRERRTKCDRKTQDWTCYCL